MAEVFVPLFWLSFSRDGGILCYRSFGKFKRLSLRQKDNFCMKFISDYGLYVHFSAKYSLFGMVQLLPNVLFYASTMSYIGYIFVQMDGWRGRGSTARMSTSPTERIRISLLLNVYFFWERILLFWKSSSKTRFRYVLTTLIHFVSWLRLHGTLRPLSCTFSYRGT